MNRLATPANDCTLVLVRHAHTEMAGRFCGHSDPPLSEEGRRQLAALGERLRRYSFQQVFSSDLRRARETAEAIAKFRSVEVSVDSSLREINFGEWEGLDWDEIEARDPQYAERWLNAYSSIPAPGGEEFGSFLLRIEAGMKAAADRIPGGCAVVVTHAGVIRSFLGSIAAVHGKHLDLSNCNYCSCWEVQRIASQWRLPGEGKPFPGDSYSLQTSSPSGWTL